MRSAMMAGSVRRGRPRWPAALVALGLLSAPLALSGPAAGAPEPTAQSALAADQELARAMRDNDVAALGRLLGDEWVVVSAFGRIAERGPVLEAIKAGDWTHHTYALSDARVRLYGTVAVITWAVKTSGTYGGKNFDVALRQTDVLVWRNGAWRAVLTHEAEMRDS